MNMEKVSVVVPVYNAEKCIKECLESVLSQDYENIEIVLIDDGSTDKSAEICKDYQKRYNDKVKYVYQNNSGPASARNKGIECSTGKYIAFVDSDDTVSTDMIGSLIKKAEEYNTDMVICAYWLVENNTETECHYEFKEGFYDGQGVEELLYSLMVEEEKSIPPYSWVRLTRKSVFTDNNLFFQNGLIRSEDYHFWTKVHAVIKNVYLLSETPLYKYIINSGSVTHSYVKKYWDGVKFIYEDLEKFIPSTEKGRLNLELMYVKRALIALNNSAMNPSAVQAWKEMWGIVRDKRLNQIVKSLSKKGVNRFASFRKMMNNHGHFIIVCKYMAERFKGRK